MRVAREEFMNNLAEYMKRAENDEEVFIIDDETEVAVLVKAARYKAYKPAGEEFDIYDWK